MTHSWSLVLECTTEVNNWGDDPQSPQWGTAMYAYLPWCLMPRQVVLLRIEPRLTLTLPSVCPLRQPASVPVVRCLKLSPTKLGCLSVHSQSPLTNNRQQEKSWTPVSAAAKIARGNFTSAHAPQIEPAMLLTLGAACMQPATLRFLAPMRPIADPACSINLGLTPY